MKQLNELKRVQPQDTLSCDAEKRGTLSTNSTADSSTVHPLTPNRAAAVSFSPHTLFTAGPDEEESGETEYVWLLRDIAIPPSAALCVASRLSAGERVMQQTERGRVSVR